MIKKRENTVAFADIWLSHTEKQWDNHWLKKVEKKVNWNKFSYRFEKLYDQDTGRPAWDSIVLFKALLLAQWYGLSDRDMEEALNDRISFRKFVGLRWDEDSPDATTFSVFRERILPIKDKLMRILNQQLEAAGFSIKETVSIDATLVEAHSKPSGDFEGDADASWRGFPTKEIIDDEGNKVFARRQALFGYKINMSADVDVGFINELSVCSASEHESRHFKELLTPKTQTVFTDKGYFNCKKIVKDCGIRDGIQDKGFRNRPLTEKQISRNKKISSYRKIIEGIFGSWKVYYNWRKTKYVGLVKNHLMAVVTALSWNMKKWACLPDRQAFSSA